VPVPVKESHDADPAQQSRRRMTVHPYIPNSEPGVRAEMLAATGASDVADFYAAIPAALRVDGLLDLPEPFTAEADLVRHVEGLLGRNTSTREAVSFLGAGCYRHHVPAVCDEVNGRSEFLTAYAGEPYEDHGRFQALFEYASMMGELLEMDVVTVPVYDGYQASATALRMAGRTTGRPAVLVTSAIAAGKRSKIGLPDAGHAGPRPAGPAGHRDGGPDGAGRRARRRHCGGVPGEP